MVGIGCGGECGAEAWVKWLVNERRIIPISEHCLESMVQSKCLVDYPGGGMVVYKISPKGGVLHSTWSVLCVVTNGKDVALRAFKGPSFNSICKHAQSDIIMSAGQAPGKPDYEALAVEARRKFPAQMRKAAVAADQVTLHGWAMRETVEASERMCAAVELGGGGLSANRLRADGFFDVGLSSTPHRVQLRIGEALRMLARTWLVC